MFCFFKLNMTHEIFLKKPYTFIWKPKYVRNAGNFSNVLAGYRSRYAAASRGSAEERKIVSNFNRNYTAWLQKSKEGNNKARKQLGSFRNNLIAARRSGNEAAVQNVLKKYNVSAGSVRKASPARRTPVSRSASPQRSGKKRNTSNLRKAMANRNLSQIKANLMAQKAVLESERNKLETQIFAIIRKIGELPNR
jgi:hypothetical protein